MPAKAKMKIMGRAMVMMFLSAAVALASGDWSLFKGQVNGPVSAPDRIDLSTFQHKKYPGMFWSEVYYHQMSFSDGSSLTVQAGVNPREASLLFVYGKPGSKPVVKHIITSADQAVFSDKGFNLGLGKSRFWLEGRNYYLDLDLETVQAKINWQILGPSYTYGDGFLRYPDSESFSYYTLPISWARASGQLVIEGRKLDLEGYGNMNHDLQVLSPIYAPANWQVFWFFGPDHSLAVTDFFTHPKFGRIPVQRLVFVDQAGHRFTSTRFAIQWDDWAEASDIPFRYPRHYTLKAEARDAGLELEVRLKEFLLREDLFSNLPRGLRMIAERLTANGWTYDFWADYTLTYREQGRAATFQGRGIVRWTDLEKDKK